MSHESLREALGAYTLGALDRSERAQVDAHLAGCQACREELASLAGLPGLLSRLSDEEASAGLIGRDARTAEQAVAAIAAERRAGRTRLHRWQALAAAALAGLVVLAVALLPVAGEGPDAVLVPRPAAADAARIDGSLNVIDRAWGMTVELDLRGLPVRDGYSLVAVTTDDHRAVAASWSGFGQDQVRLTGACYVSRELLDRLEVVTPDGEVLVVFDA
jgi:hypothetical protein